MNLARFFVESKRATWHLEIAGRLNRLQTPAQAEAIIDEYERLER